MRFQHLLAPSVNIELVRKIALYLLGLAVLTVDYI